MVCSLSGSLINPFHLEPNDRKAAAPFGHAQEVLGDTKPTLNGKTWDRTRALPASGSSVTHWQRGLQLPCFCRHHSLVPTTNNRVICEAGYVTHQAREESLQGMTWWTAPKYLLAIGKEVLT